MKKLESLTGVMAVSREENPNLIEEFKKYNNRGFNIIGVSMDREKSKWLKAIKDE